jgi:DNA helicase-2/ATP-dependent DNA helicase PcrA
MIKCAKIHEMSYLNKLNPQQNEAVLHTEGPLLILAGAGAGKTRVITHRIAHLIKQGTKPHQILAVTFTNKAAKEMNERVGELLRTDSDFSMPVEVSGRPFIKTFHSLGVHIIKENSELVGLPRRFTIFDSADSKKVITEGLKSAGFDTKQYEPRKIQSIISNQKGDMVTFEEYEKSGHRRSYIGDAVSKAWSFYEKRLKEEGAVDFDDLLMKSVQILEKNKEVLDRYNNLWKYIHIDEYQDTNAVQYKMSKLLAAKNKNLCVVGDIDQNIYSWRGATIENIMNFEKDYPETKEIVLEENYRSTQNILQAANEIISKNKVRKEKNLFTKNGEGEKVSVYQAIDEYDEATFVVQTAKQLIASGTNPDEIAFLYRANFQSRVLEEICLKENIPHQVIGTRFFDRREIKDVLSYIKSALNEKDFTSLSRIINTPKRGIGKVTVLKLAEGKNDELSPAVAAKISNFKSFLNKISEMTKTKKPHEVIEMILKESGLEESFKNEGEDGQERLENVKELIAVSKKYEIYEPAEAIEKLIEDVSLASDQDEMNKDNRGVKLMTVHAAKGLEFDNVFITGLEAGLFPHARFDEKGQEDSEEERRLFYVAVTRARKKLFLSYASFRTIYGSKEVNTPSEFLQDIDEDLLDYESFTKNYDNDSSFDDSDDPEDNRPKREYLIDF